ncbi:MAG: 50S ribosomal protein L11 methyltransferase [Bacteroidales bacterium]|nr:50S ribosomal protein L11 methyltransferase [Bacteroidales bacterium]MCF8345202.1 50S ribosomal protein L11 methyltransferase [Bacteroidales bacterium]MCF8352477.1 50S ribosomal protein L11 methyltransferase [Bacteroidales bacterium]MCF8377297.1 50S ribosomal protein L11 methyltransferase [Bacteroidales bacterium]MCF8401399.1 50S ribosomal protein L11 methyltransferase [Bacteroidales bacterium]
MDYIQISFSKAPLEIREILSAMLSAYGYDNFQEDEEQLMAFIGKENFSEDELKEVLSGELFREITYSVDLISEKNWNEIWEQNFEAVVIAGKCLIRAPFHKIESPYEYNLIIEPQMSFGTAHHETTACMLELMLELDFENKSVLDMGCGTGILAIFASLKKASRVVAIDNSSWAVQNTRHNMALNGVKNIKALEGDAGHIPEEKFDYILANINRNVLLEDVPKYSNYHSQKGLFLLSGFLQNDLASIQNMLAALAYVNVHKIVENDWVAAVFQRE